MGRGRPRLHDPYRYGYRPKQLQAPLSPRRLQGRARGLDDARAAPLRRLAAVRHGRAHEGDQRDIGPFVRSQGSTDPSTRRTDARRRHSSKKAPAVTSSASCTLLTSLRAWRYTRSLCRSNRVANASLSPPRAAAQGSLSPWARSTVSNVRTQPSVTPSGAAGKRAARAAWGGPLPVAPAASLVTALAALSPRRLSGRDFT